MGENGRGEGFALVGEDDLAPVDNLNERLSDTGVKPGPGGEAGSIGGRESRREDTGQSRPVSLRLRMSPSSSRPP